MKILTLANWLALDEGIANTVRIDESGRTQPTSANDWLPIILEPQLSDEVPSEVHELFHVAQAAMAYGLLYLPLMALSVEQLFRVAEAAVLHRARTARACPTHTKYQANLNFLVREGVIERTDRERWQSFRKARDVASHPSQQMVMNPAAAIQILQAVTERINSLFLSV